MRHYVFDFNYLTSLTFSLEISIWQHLLQLFWFTVIKTIKIYYEYRSISAGDFVYCRRKMSDHDANFIGMRHIITDYQIDLISSGHVSKFNRFIWFLFVSELEVCSEVILVFTEFSAPFSQFYVAVYCIFSCFPVLCCNIQAIIRNFFRGKVDKLPKI